MKERAKVYILEDDATVRQQLVAFVESVPALELLGASDSPMRIGSVMHQNPPDLLILDIGLPFLNGYQFLDMLQKKPKVVIVSSDASNAVEAFTKGAVDFLLKPIGHARFLKAISRATGVELNGAINTSASRSAGPEDEVLDLKSGKRAVQIRSSQIQLVQGMGNYVKLHMANGNMLVNETMAHMESMLQKERFVRIHRSFIVALDAVSSFNSRTVECLGRDIPVGSIYRRQAIDVISNHLMGIRS